MIRLDKGKIVNKREMMSDNNNKQRLYPTRLDIPAESRAGAIAILNQTLAASLDLKTQVKQAPWNVKGMDLLHLHEMFDEMASELEEYIDMVAERIAALGDWRWERLE